MSEQQPGWPPPEPPAEPLAQPPPPPEPAPEPMPGNGAARRPRRLSPLTPLVRGGILLVALVVTSWDDLLDGGLGPMGAVLLAVLTAGAVFGYASWLRTTYWIEDDELRIDKGVVSRQSRRIRIDRLQGVDIVQPVVARVFGLAEVRMDTAGGDREGTLAFLPLAEAQRLRQTLLARRDAVRRPKAGEVASGGPATWAPPDHDLAVLDLRTLLLSTLISPSSVGVAVGAVVIVFVSSAVGMVAAAPSAPLLVGFLLVQVRRLSAYYGFVVSRTSVGLQVRRGLLERSTQTIALARVQGVVLTEPWMWRPFGWARLDVSVAGYGSGGDEGEGGPSASTVMPVAPRGQVLELARMLLRGDDEDVDVELDEVVTSAPPRAARWLDPIGRRFLDAGLGRDVALSRRGRFTRRTHAVRHARVQSLRLWQGPIQRRLGLADLHLDSPPGPVHVRFRHRAEADARALLDRAEELARAARAER